MFGEIRVSLGVFGLSSYIYTYIYVNINLHLIPYTPTLSTVLGVFGCLVELQYALLACKRKVWLELVLNLK